MSKDLYWLKVAAVTFFMALMWFLIATGGKT